MKAGSYMKITPAAQLSGTPVLRARLHQAVKAVTSWAVVWIVASSIAATFWLLPQISALVPEQSMIFRLARSFLPSFASAMTVGFAICLSSDSGVALARRPGRFVAALMLGATCAIPVVWAIDWLLPIKSNWELPRRLLDWWLTVILFGMFFGWAAVLYWQRIEDQARLTLLLSRRSLLTRQLAQLRFSAARAQIDPELVARILRRVQDRYRVNDDSAAVLLEQLICYLRLAMGRIRSQRASSREELALLRAYVALREAETGTRIALQLNLVIDDDRQDVPFSLPLFLLSRKMLEAVPAVPALAVCIQRRGDHLFVELGSAVAIPADRLERLREDLCMLTGTGIGMDILQHFSDTGINRYVVQTAIA
jgi:hypothetical protein